MPCCLKIHVCDSSLPPGNVEEARGILRALQDALPSLATVRLRRVSLERRHGNLEGAEAVLREAMESAQNASETSFYAVKLARQLMKVQKSLGRARKVLLEAIEKDQVRGPREHGGTLCQVKRITFRMSFIELSFYKQEMCYCEIGT